MSDCRMHSCLLVLFRNTILIQIRISIVESICIAGKRTGIGKRATTMMNKKGVRTHESTSKESFVFGRASVCSSMCVLFFCFLGGGYLRSKIRLLLWRAEMGGCRQHLKFFSNTIYNMIARVLFLFLMEKDCTSNNNY